MLPPIHFSLPTGIAGVIFRGLFAGLWPLIFIFFGNPTVSLHQILLATPVAFGLFAAFLGHELQMPALTLFSAALVGSFLNAFGFSLSVIWGPLSGLRPDTVSILCVLLSFLAVGLSLAKKETLVALPAAPQAFLVLAFFAIAPRLLPDHNWLVLAWAWRAPISFLHPFNFGALLVTGTLLFQTFRTERPSAGPILMLLALVCLWAMDELLLKQLFVRVRSELFVSLPFVCASCFLLYGELNLYWQRIYTDELTGVLNRRALNERLWRLRPHYVIAMIDIDHFKRFNDTYGHEQGDTVLRFVAAHFSKPSHGTTYRYGGEEFCIVFNNISAAHAARILDEMRESLAQRVFHIRSSKQYRQLTSKKDRKAMVAKARTNITVSIGVADPQSDTQTTDDVLKVADTALYQAKHHGRNRVVESTPTKPVATAV